MRVGKIEKDMGFRPYQIIIDIDTEEEETRLGAIIAKTKTTDSMASVRMASDILRVLNIK